MIKLARAIALIFILVGIVTTAGKIQAEELNVRTPTQGEIGKSATCPVTNEKFEVGKDTPVIDYKGKSYFFCCAGCVETFKKDPEYAQTEELNVRKPTQGEIGKSAICPVAKEKFEVGEDTPVIDYKGKSYFFCCAGCVGTFKKNPDRFAE